MSFLSEEKTAELYKELEGGLGEGGSIASSTPDVKEGIETAPAVEERVEVETMAPEVPDVGVGAEAEAGDSEEQADAAASDGNAEEESAPPGHRVPYKRFKSVLDARNRYKSEADDRRSQMEAYERQAALMRDEMSALRNLQPAKPAESVADPIDAELDRLLAGHSELPPEVRQKITAMESRLHQQEVHVERQRLRHEVAEVVGKHDERLHKDIQQVLYSAVQRDPNADLGSVAEQYVVWLAQREEEAIARYLKTNPDASVEEVVEATSGTTPGVPSRPKRAGTGASRVATAADRQAFGSIAEGSEALLGALKKGTLNLFG
jgi:hypothetical protein